MHSVPTDANEDAFYLAGRAAFVTEGATRDRLADLFVAERAASTCRDPETVSTCSSSRSRRAC